MTIKNFLVKIGADDSELQKSLGKARKTLKDHSAQFRKAGRAMTVAGAAITGAVGMMVKGYIKAGDEVHKMALRTGFSTEALSELKYAADISGASLSDVEKGVKKMSKTILDADDGLTTYIRAFDRIGLQAKDLIKLSPEQQFDKIAKAIASVENPTIRAATAQDIFGRAGTKLLPLFAAGEKGLDALRQKARDMGIVFDQEAANKAATLQDSLTTLKDSFRGVTMSIASTLVPVITSLVDKISSVATKIKDWMKEHPKLAGTIMKVVVALGGLMVILGPLLIMLPGIATGMGMLSKSATLMAAKAKILAAINYVLGTSFTTMLGPISLVIAAIAGIAAGAYLVVKHWKTIKEFFSNLWNKISNFFGTTLGKIISICLPFIGIPMQIIRNWGKIKEFFSNLFDGIKKKLLDWAISITGILEKIPIVKKFAGPWKESLEKIRAELTQTEQIVSEKSIQMGKDLLEGIKKTKIFAKVSGFLGDKVKGLASIFTTTKKKTDELSESYKKVSEKQQTWIEYLKSIGIQTVKEKHSRVVELEAIIRNLNAAYDQGKLSTASWTAAVKKAKDEIDKLNKAEIEEVGTKRDGLTVLQMMPAAYKQTTFAMMDAEQLAIDFGNAYGKTTEQIDRDTYNLTASMMGFAGITMPKVTQSVKDAYPQIKDAAEKSAGSWTKASQWIQDQWTMGLKSMLMGSRSFKDVLGSIWGNIKEQAFTVIAQIGSKFITGFINEAIGGIGKVASGLKDGIGGAAKGLGDLFGGVTGKVGDLFKGIGKLAGGLSPGGILGGAISGLVSGLVGGKGISKQTGQDQLHALRLILEVLDKNIAGSQLLGVLAYQKDTLGTLSHFRDHALSMMDVQTKKLQSISIFTKATAKACEAVIKALKSLPTAQTGAHFDRPTLAVVGEVPETVIPDKKLPGIARSTSVILNAQFNINTLDPRTMRQVVRNEIAPEMIQMIKTGLRKSELKGALLA